MQRAAAKSSPASPATPNGRPTKKARLLNGAGVGTSDQEIIQSAVDAEEEKRQAALDKAAEHAGETKWVLSFQDPLKGKRQDAMEVRQAGFAEIDAEDESEEEEEIKPVRMQFGGGVKKAEVGITKFRWYSLLISCRFQYLLRKLKGRNQDPGLHLTITTQTILLQTLSGRRSARWLQRNEKRRSTQAWATNHKMKHQDDKARMRISTV